MLVSHLDNNLMVSMQLKYMAEEFHGYEFKSCLNMVTMVYAVKPSLRMRCNVLLARSVKKKSTCGDREQLEG